MKASNAISSRTESPEASPGNEESSSTTKRFTLGGPSADLDPRYDAFRPELADVALADRLFAPHYVEPVSRLVEKGPAPLREKPYLESEIIAELKAGEGFALLEIAGAWAWGYRESDHLVGYLEASLLSSPAS